MCLNLLTNQPLSITKIWKNSFNLYKATFAKVWYIALALAITSTAWLYLIDFHKNILNLYSYRTTVILMLAVALVAILSSTYLYIALMQRIYQYTTSRENMFKNALKISVHKFGTYLLNLFYLVWISIVILGISLLIFYLNTKTLELFNSKAVILSNTYNIVHVIDSILCLIYIIISVYIFLLLLFSFMFCLPLILFENKTAWQAIKIGIKLAWGKSWHITLGYLPVFIVNIPMQIFYALTTIIYKQNHLLFIILTVFSILIYTVILPISASFILVQLNDLKMRKQMIQIWAPKTNNEARADNLS